MNKTMSSNMQLSYCVNCSSHLSKRADNRQKALFHEIPTGDPLITAKIKVQSVLSSIFKLQYFDDLKFLVDQDDIKWSTNDSDSEIGVCESCYNVLVNLFNFYNQFNQLRLKNSYLSNAISSLDNLAHRLEVILESSHIIQDLKSAETDVEENEDEEEVEGIFTEQGFTGMLECEFDDDFDTNSVHQHRPNKLNPVVVSFPRLEGDDIDAASSNTAKRRKIKYESCDVDECTFQDKTPSSQNRANEVKVSQDTLMTESIKEKFLDKVEAFRSLKHNNSQIYSSEKLESIIHVLINFETIKTKEKAHYYYKRHYEVCTSGDKQILRKKGSTRQVVCIDDLFEILVNAHYATKHGGRDAMAKYLCEHFANVTREEISAFISLCEQCQHRRVNIRKRNVSNYILST